jgi:preprotein translocase subunit SecD
MRLFWSIIIIVVAIIVVGVLAVIAVVRAGADAPVPQEDLGELHPVPYRIASAEAAALRAQIERFDAIPRGEMTEELEDQLRQLKEALAAAEARAAALTGDRRDALLSALEARLTAVGFGQVRFEPGPLADRVTVMVPNAPPERLQRMLTMSGRIQFRMTPDPTDPVLGAATPDRPSPDPLRYRWMPVSANGSVHVDYVRRHAGRDWMLVDAFPAPPDPMLDGDDVDRATIANTSDARGRPAIAVAFRSDNGSATKFRDLTRRYATTGGGPSRLLCILLNEEVFWAGAIHGEITGPAVLTGFPGSRERADIHAVLRAGAIDDLYLVPIAGATD